jgi:hypothetical protein
VHHTVAPDERRFGVVHIRRKVDGSTYYDMYFTRTDTADGPWRDPVKIYNGYVGSQRTLLRLDDGRLVMPIHFMVKLDPDPRPEGKAGENYGLMDIVTLYSDDDGDTWQRSPSRLMIPQDMNRGRTNYGAVEPATIQLLDGRLWMLIRTKNGHLWESYSSDRGETWSPAKRTRFVSSDSPAWMLRLADKRMVLFLNTCQKHDDPRSYAIGGRHVLHAAISADDGKTWSGFREVMWAEDNEKARGDRGAAYPAAVQAADGMIVLVSGQGASKSIIRIDPDWLQATGASHDFKDGRGTWTSYNAPTPPIEDGRLVLDPSTDDTPVGAMWNFPAARKGQLTLRLEATEGAPYLAIALTDQFNVITDTQSHSHVVALYHDGEALRSAGEHEVKFAWDLTVKPARVTASIDGGPSVPLHVQRNSVFGINYVRVIAQGPAAKGRWFIRSAEATTK